MEPVSLRAYSRHRGVSLRAVQKAIESGRIVVRKDGRIDPDRADRDWERNTAPRPNASSGPAAPEPPGSSGAAGSPTRSPARDGGPPPRFETGLEYNKARAVRETYLARLAKLEFEEREGKLIPFDEVVRFESLQVMAARSVLLRIPSELAPYLAVTSDPAECQEMLQARIYDALSRLAEFRPGAMPKQEEE